MPYKIRRLPYKNSYRVYNIETGKIHSYGTSKENAERQRRLLYMIEGSGGFSEYYDYPKLQRDLMMGSGGNQSNWFSPITMTQEELDDLLADPILPHALDIYQNDARFNQIYQSILRRNATENELQTFFYILNRLEDQIANSLEDLEQIKLTPKSKMYVGKNKDYNKP